MYVTVTHCIQVNSIHKHKSLTFAALIHYIKNIAQFITDECYVQQNEPQVNWQIMHLFRKKKTFLLKPMTQPAREAEEVNVCVTMWIIVTPSPRHKPYASCSKNNRKWPGVFIELLCLSSSEVLHRLLWSFSWERMQLVSAGHLHALHPMCSLLNLQSSLSAFLCFLRVCWILGFLCSTNTSPGNQCVWPKSICFTRFTDAQ